jgi:ubiquinol-cytochrome c reductase iron-sulfur subunit
MRRLVRWLLGLIIASRTARQLGHTPEEPERPRIVEAGEPDPRAEAIVIVLLVLVALACALFVVAYGLGWSTQALGGTLGGALALLAVALIIVARHLIVTEEIPEPYPETGDPEEQEKLAQVVRESGSRFTRKRLITGAAATAGGAMGVALVTPAVSLGPVFDTSRLNETPWKRNVALVDKDGRAYTADDIGTGTFYTAYPEHSDQDAIGAPLVLVRLDPARVKLPPGRESWAPEGIVAYSKICTHAGCAVALYRNPLFQPSEPSQALVCPCHYSTFDVATGGTVLFGPAGRPLPQLPLLIDGARGLRAAGNFSGPVGPSWWGVRGRPTSS